MWHCSRNMRKAAAGVPMPLTCTDEGEMRTLGPFPHSPRHPHSRAHIPSPSCSTSSRIFKICSVHCQVRVTLLTQQAVVTRHARFRCAETHLLRALLPTCSVCTDRDIYNTFSRSALATSRRLVWALPNGRLTRTHSRHATPTETQPQYYKRVPRTSCFHTPSHLRANVMSSCHAFSNRDEHG